MLTRLIMSIIFSFPNAHAFAKVCKQMDLGDAVLDHGGNCIPVGVEAALQLIKKALTNRIISYGINYHSYDKVNTFL